MTELLDLVDVGCDEAGAALLGSALLGDTTACAAVTELREDDLTEVRQRAVAAAIQALIARSAPVGPVTVLGEMRANGSAARLPAGRDCGVYLTDLMEQGMAGHPRHTFAVILEHGVRRAARQAGLRIQQAAGSMPLADLPDFVAQQAGAVLVAVRRREAAL